MSAFDINNFNQINKNHQKKTGHLINKVHQNFSILLRTTMRQTNTYTQTDLGVKLTTSLLCREVKNRFNISKCFA